MGRTLLGAVLCFAVYVTAPASAQPRDKQVATEISLIELDEPNQGSMAMIDGRLEGTEADRFTLANLSIFQPVKVSLIAEEISQPVTLQLGKFDWKEDFGGGKTGEGGSVTREFKTQGDLLLTVSGGDGSGHRLIIWAGDEVPPEMEPVIVPASEATGDWTKYLLFGLGALALLGAGWFFMRTRRRTA